MTILSSLLGRNLGIGINQPSTPPKNNNPINIGLPNFAPNLGSIANLPALIQMISMLLSQLGNLGNISGGSNGTRPNIDTGNTNGVVSAKNSSVKVGGPNRPDSKVATILGKQYTVGFLKQQIPAFDQVFKAQSYDAGYFNSGWGEGFSIIHGQEFEKFVKSRFPNGQPGLAQDHEGDYTIAKAKNSLLKVGFVDVPDSKQIDVGNVKFSLGFLKSQVPAFDAVYKPSSLEVSGYVGTHWGMDNRMEDVQAFEKFILSRFPNGEPTKS